MVRKAQGEKGTSDKAMGHALAQIAYGQARKGKIDEANETFVRAKNIAYTQSDALCKDLVLREIAYRQAEIGMLGDSLTTIYEMEFSENRNWAVSRLAFESIRRGKRRAAKKLSRMISDELILCPLLTELADHEFTEGKFNTAISTILEARIKARKIRSEHVRKTALESLDEIERDMEATLHTLDTQIKL